MSVLWQRQDECASCPGRAREADRSAQQFCQFLAQMQPEPGSVRAARRRRQWSEGAEELLLVLRLDADSCVDHVNGDYAALRIGIADFEAHETAFGELDRIVREVDQDLTQGAT